MKKIVIIGGGISGLTCAYMIKKDADERGLDIDLKLLESDNRVGGKIRSDIIDGYLCEWGPHAVFLNKPQNVKLIEDLSIQNDVVPANPSANKRFIFYNGRLNLVPDSPPTFITSKILPFSAKLRILLEPWTRPSPPGKDESIAEFAGRHLGKVAVSRLIDPMVTGVFAGDHTKLSVKSCFPVMLGLEEEGSGSLFKAMIRRMKAKKKAARKSGADTETIQTGMWTSNYGSFKSGVQGFVDALKDNLSNEIASGSTITSLNNKNGRYIITAENGLQYEGDIVVIATPAYAAASILKELLPGLNEELNSIPYAPVNVVNFGYDKNKVKHPVEGFGFVVPSSERRRILGSVWMSSFFSHASPAGTVLLRNMVGGVRKPELTELDDASLTKTVQEELLKTMGIEESPDFVNIVRHDKAVPQYLIGHLDKVGKIEKTVSAMSGLFITGNAYRGVSIHDCVTNANKTAEKVIDKITA